MNFIILFVLALFISLPDSTLNAAANTSAPAVAQGNRVPDDTSTPKNSLLSSTSWLVGTWALSYDPDGSEKDYLDFYADGKVDNRDGKGNHRLIDYRVSPGSVALSFTASGATKSFPLQIVENGTKLKNSSGAEYTRLPDVAGVNYTRSGWSRFVSEKGKFSVLMYGVPLAEVTTKGSGTEDICYSVELENCLFTVRFGGLDREVTRENITSLYDLYEMHFIDGISRAENTLLDSSSTTIFLKKLPAREMSGKMATGSNVMYYRSLITFHNNLFYQFALFFSADFADRAPDIIKSIEFDNL
jgi:hypothetical protein